MFCHLPIAPQSGDKAFSISGDIYHSNHNTLLDLILRENLWLSFLGWGTLQTWQGPQVQPSALFLEMHPPDTFGSDQGKQELRWLAQDHCAPGWKCQVHSDKQVFLVPVMGIVL
jgi:hypothetical protein